MIVVIQCASSKVPSAGRMCTSDGLKVEFVARPNLAPTTPGVLYARPDDLHEGQPWREHVLDYNREPGANPLGLLPAAQLYRPPAYRRLVERFGETNIYILSAGWGLITATFLTPAYDITFSSAQNVAPYKRRRPGDRYDDFRMLPNETRDEVVFLGGKDYLPLFCRLTQRYAGSRVVMYNSATIPEAPGCKLKRFETSTRTNWHYACAVALMRGRPYLGL